MQRDNAHLRIMIKQQQMFTQLDCLISSTFQCIMQLSNGLSHCSCSGGTALNSVSTAAAGFTLFVSIQSTSHPKYSQCFFCLPNHRCFCFLISPLQAVFFIWNPLGEKKEKNFIFTVRLWELKQTYAYWKGDIYRFQFSPCYYGVIMESNLQLP